MKAAAAYGRLSLARLGIAFFLLVGALLFSTHQAAAQSQVAQFQSLGTVSEVVVRGNQRVERETILAIFNVFPGDSLDPVAVNEGVRALFDSGLFADVSVNLNGNAIIIDVVENVFVNRVVFEGNSGIRDEDLAAIVELKPLGVFTEAIMRDDLRRIIRVYEATGRFNVTVVPQIIERDQGRVDVVFEIDEGNRLRISSVGFVGNTVYDDNRLMQVVASRQQRWWRRITNGDVFDPNKLELDALLLTRFYQDRGFADMRVTASRGEIDAAGTGVVVTFSVSEGERYTIDEIRLEGDDVDALPQEEMLKQISVREGDLYNLSRIQESSDALTVFLADQGFPSSLVTPDFERDEDNRLIDIIFRVEEGPKVQIERVEIRGNSRTRDYVIRREMRVSEGDVFNRNRITRSQERLAGLGYFTNVSVTTGPGSSDDQVILYVDVEEGSTGTLNFGGSYSSDTGFAIQVGYTNRNLLGRGQSLGVNLDTGQDNRTLSVNFFEPYFAGRNMGAGVNAWYTQDTQSTDYDLDETGLGFTIAYALSERVSQSWSYTFKTTEIEVTSTSTSTFLREEAGITERGILGHRLTYVDVDDGAFPTRGWFLQMRNEVAGLGGNVNWLSTTGEAIRFIPLGDGGRVRFSGELGFITGFGGDSVPFADRLSGGTLVRGFSSSGIGPREVGSDTSFRGTQFYAGSAEAAYPLPGLSAAGFLGRVFIDAGALWEPGDAGVGVALNDSSALRWSYGFGLTWNSPLGPLDFDWGYAQEAEDYDDQEVFSFSIGTSF